MNAVAPGIQIDDAVEIPPKKGKLANHTAPDWPLARLQVGQSFFTPGFSLAVKAAASEYERLHPPTKFTSRAYDDTRPDPVTGKTGVRIWRTR